MIYESAYIAGIANNLHLLGDKANPEYDLSIPIALAF